MLSSISAHLSSMGWKRFGCAPPDKRIAFVRDELIYRPSTINRLSFWRLSRIAWRAAFLIKGGSATNRGKWQVWGMKTSSRRQG